MTKRAKKFPMFHAWCGREAWTGDWSCGFFLAPCPAQEHNIGDMVKALAFIELRLRKGKLTLRDWSFDPSLRPIG